MEYDLVIIGAGPAGLALAQCVSSLSKKILIIEKDNVIGGCHSVKRVNGLFTEHSPRIYGGNYKVFQSLLKQMNLDFYTLFTEYNFRITKISQPVLKTLTTSELFILFKEFIKLLLNPNHGTNTSLSDFLYKKSFTPKSIDIIDRVSRLADGAGIGKYTLNKFLQVANQNPFYKFYQPSQSTDTGLFTLWTDYLKSKGVDILINTQIDKIDYNQTQITKIYLSNHKSPVYASNYVFAIPPKNLAPILYNFKIPHQWGDFNKFAIRTAYEDYISISFHWNIKMPLPKIHGFPVSDWGVFFVVVTDYTPFENKESQTVISTTVSLPDNVSKRTNKTANQSSKQEVINEVFLQLNEVFKILPPPTASVMTPNTVYDTNKKQWISGNTAFIPTAEYNSISFQNIVLKNMYTLGTHNGKSLYKATSMESAVSNSVYLSKLLYPELNNSRYISLHQGVSISTVFYLTILIILIIIVIRNL